MRLMTEQRPNAIQVNPVYDEMKTGIMSNPMELSPDFVGSFVSQVLRKGTIDNPQDFGVIVDIARKKIEMKARAYDDNPFMAVGKVITDTELRVWMSSQINLPPELAAGAKNQKRQGDPTC